MFMKNTEERIHPLKIPINEYPEFSTRLKITIQIRGYSIEQLAKDTYVTKSTIYGYLNGTRSPNLIILRLLAESLDVSTDFLIGLKEYIYI